MKKVYAIGEKSKAICENCGLVATTFLEKDVPVDDSKVVVKNLLVAVCDQCSEVVGIPMQSVDQIAEALKGKI